MRTATAETAVAHEQLRKAHLEMDVMGRRCSELREQAHVEASAKLQAANDHATIIRAAHRESQDLRIEAQSLQFQLDQLSQLHPTSGTTSDEVRESYRNSIKAIQYSAEENMKAMEADRTEYQQQVRLEMQAAVQQYAQSQEAVARLEAEVQSTREDLLGATARLPKEYERQASGSTAPSFNPNDDNVPYTLYLKQKTATFQMETG